MAKGKTKQERAYELFCEGKTSSSPEVKALDLKASTRYSYYSRWQTEGKPSSPPSSSPLTGKKIKGGTPLSSGESIGSLSEIPEDKSKEKPEESKKEKSMEMDEPSGELKEGNEKLKEKIKDKPEVKGIPEVIAGQGIPVHISVSVKTLALYQIAASVQGDDLSLGDFVDVCVEDTFRVRGKDLGLIKLGGKK